MIYYHERINDTMVGGWDIDWYAYLSFKALEKQLKVKDKLEEPDYTAALATIFPRLLNSKRS